MYGDFAFGCIVVRALFIILPFPLTEHWTGTSRKTLLSVHMVCHCGSGICQGCSHICAPKIPFSRTCNDSTAEAGRGKSCLNQKNLKNYEKIC